MNTVDFRTKILGFRGEEMKDGEPVRSITLGDIVLRALNIGPAKGAMDAREMTERFELQRQIVASEKHGQLMDLTSEQQALIKSGIAVSGFTPWIAGQAMEMIETGTEQPSAGASVVALRDRAVAPSGAVAPSA